MPNPAAKNGIFAAKNWAINTTHLANDNSMNNDRPTLT